MTKGANSLQSLINILSQAILGKEALIKHFLIGLAAEGHILFEDVPGVGKTTLVKGLAKAIGCEFKRIQCNPDLLPTDITGVTVYNDKTGEWEFQKGPVFTQILLVDEINRTSPKTQSALLEPMEEKQVTVDGTTYFLQDPFFVLATQNSHEYEGTFPLPESQLDRFIMRLSLGYPSKQHEISLLTKVIHTNPLNYIEQIMDPQDFLAIQREIQQVYVTDELLEYAADLSITTRNHEKVQLGISPRGTLNLIKCSKATAYICGRDFVLPDDIQEMFFPVCMHRLVVDQNMFLEHNDKEIILKDILSQVKVPGSAGRR